MMKFTDRTLTCLDCGEQFVFSAGEQIFFSEKRFQHEPKRCKKCKAKRTNVRARVKTSVNCAACGISTTVPFVPRQERPVLCRVCLRLQRDQERDGALVQAQLSEQVQPSNDQSQSLAAESL